MNDRNRILTYAAVSVVAVSAGIAGWWAIIDADDPAPAMTVPATGTMPRTLPTCDDMYAPGRPTADVVADTAAMPCDAGHSALFAVAVSWDCPDGTQVHQVQGYGWGRDGDVWHPATDPAPYADCVMPGTDTNHP